MAFRLSIFLPFSSLWRLRRISTDEKSAAQRSARRRHRHDDWREVIDCDNTAAHADTRSPFYSSLFSLSFFSHHRPTLPTPNKSTTAYISETLYNNKSI